MRSTEANGFGSVRLSNSCIKDSGLTAQNPQGGKRSLFHARRLPPSASTFYSGTPTNRAGDHSCRHGQSSLRPVKLRPPYFQHLSIFAIKFQLFSRLSVQQERRTLGLSENQKMVIRAVAFEAC